MLRYRRLALLRDFAVVRLDLFDRGFGPLFFARLEVFFFESRFDLLVDFLLLLGLGVGLFRFSFVALWDVLLFFDFVLLGADVSFVFVLEGVWGFNAGGFPLQ